MDDKELARIVVLGTEIVREKRMQLDGNDTLNGTCSLLHDLGMNFSTLKHFIKPTCWDWNCPCCYSRLMFTFDISFTFPLNTL